MNDDRPLLHVFRRPTHLDELAPNAGLRRRVTRICHRVYHSERTLIKGGSRSYTAAQLHSRSKDHRRRTLHDHEVALRPGPPQVERAASRAHTVVPPLHDDGGDVPDLVHVPRFRVVAKRDEIRVRRLSVPYTAAAAALILHSLQDPGVGHEPALVDKVVVLCIMCIKEPRGAGEPMKVVSACMRATLPYGTYGSRRTH